MAERVPSVTEESIFTPASVRLHHKHRWDASVKGQIDELKMEF